MSATQSGPVAEVCPWHSWQVAVSEGGTCTRGETEMQRYSLRVIPFALLIAVTYLLTIPGTIADDRAFEKAEDLSAADILPADLLKGEHYTLDDRVRNDGYLNYYTISSDYGAADESRGSDCSEFAACGAAFGVFATVVGITHSQMRRARSGRHITRPVGTGPRFSR